MKNEYTIQMLGSKDCSIIMFKEKEYRDYEDNNGYTRYNIVKCPACDKEMLDKYEKDETQGFRDSFTMILDRACDCDIEDKLKEKGIYLRKNNLYKI